MPQRLSTALALVLALACGADRKASEQATAPLKVQPSEVTVTPRALQQFTLTPTTVQVTWSVAETGGGSITTTGTYTAPGFSGQFHVVATSTTNALASATATVNVDSGITITPVSPVTEVACVPMQLTATVAGPTNDTGVVWSAPAACGTVTATGLFTSLRGTGPCVVAAQAHADQGKVTSITVNVTPEGVLSVAISPTQVPTLATGGSQAFTASATTTCGTFPAGQ